MLTGRTAHVTTQSADRVTGVTDGCFQKSPKREAVPNGHPSDLHMPKIFASNRQRGAYRTSHSLTSILHGTDFCFWEAPFATADLVLGAIRRGENVERGKRDQRWWMEEGNESWREKAVVTVDS